MSRSHPDVTQKRRDLIVEVVGEAPGCTFKALLERLCELHGEGRWPRAPWPGARQDPYDVGLRQHVNALVEKGLVLRVEKPGHYPTYSLPLRPHAEDCLRLKAKGRNGLEIASELGLSKSLVSSLLRDPTGIKERERKKRYCGSCGAPKDPEKDWCPKCVGSKVEALMPPRDESAFWQNAMVRARRRGVEFVIGVTPSLDRLIRVDTGRGRFDRVLRANEEYEDVARELGLVD